LGAAHYGTIEEGILRKQHQNLENKRDAANRRDKRKTQLVSLVVIQNLRTQGSHHLGKNDKPRVKVRVRVKG
jgi:hypothetical protein